MAVELVRDEVRTVEHVGPERFDVNSSELEQHLTNQRTRPKQEYQSFLRQESRLLPQLQATNPNPSTIEDNLLRGQATSPKMWHFASNKPSLNAMHVEYVRVYEGDLPFDSLAGSLLLLVRL